MPTLWCFLLVLPCQLHAQQGVGPTPGTPGITTLERVEATRPQNDVLDLYRFTNPVTVEPNRFDGMYDAGKSPEQIALAYGGYINYGINLGLQSSWTGLKKATGMRAQTQSPVARQSPLSDEQMRRAARACDLEGSTCPGGE